MASKKGDTIFIKLVSTAINPKTGKKTGFYYTTKKNTRSERTKDRKLEFRKYDPVVRQHVVFKEEKMKS